MTRKEKVFRHIEDNRNAMRYTDIIKFAYEDKYGVGKFDKKKNRGFYSDAFAHHSFQSSGGMIKKVGSAKGHFVTPTKNGQLVKLSNGLWSVHRPLGWTRESGNCETYEARIEKFLSDGKSVTEREIVSHIKPYVVERRRKIGYDWGNTNNLLRKMIEKGKVSRVVSVNNKTCRPAYHYFAVNTQTDATKNIESNVSIPADEYESMCSGLSIYGITSDQFDERANEYWQKGDGDVRSCYSFAFNDFLREIVKEEKAQKLEQKNYIVLNVCEGHECDICDGIMGEAELRMFFINRDPKNYKVYEVGKEVKIEKEYSIKIKNN